MTKGSSRTGHPIDERKDGPSLHMPASMERLLVVDDNQRIRDTIVRAVRRAWPGALLEECDDAERALEKVRQLRSKGMHFDWMIVDHHLGAPLRGMDLLHILATESPETATVLMSGDPEVEQIAKADPRVTRFLRKPFRGEDVLGVLNA